jgi:hypothetical protein
MWEKVNLNRLLAGVAGFLVIGLLLEVQGLPSFGSRDPSAGCQKVVKAEATLSEAQLLKLMTVKKGDSKESVRSILKEPYCELPKAEIRVGAIAQRDAYLLNADDFVQFDPRTRLVVLYEGDEYAGYRFWVR